jgi:SIR2-like domain
MKNKFGYNLNEYADNEGKCISKIAAILNNQQLGLILGAGASMALNLPSWKVLVERCIHEIDSKNIVTDENVKAIAQKIKNHYKEDLELYHEKIKEKLYEGVEFNFNLARKEMLIALTSLFVGKTRGVVNNVISLNYDNVLEWYLKINGLNTCNAGKNHLEEFNYDVKILHLHGYLPNDNLYGSNSDKIVFTNEDFEDRQVGREYFKELMKDFYKRHVFVTIGLSSHSIVDDFLPYLREVNTDWYEKENIFRKQPFGIAVLTNYNDEQKEAMIRAGIIPCKVERSEIPNFIFKISQAASEKKGSKLM